MIIKQGKSLNNVKSYRHISLLSIIKAYIKKGKSIIERKIAISRSQFGLRNSILQSISVLHLNRKIYLLNYFIRYYFKYGTKAQFKNITIYYQSNNAS